MVLHMPCFFRFSAAQHIVCLDHAIPCALKNKHIDVMCMHVCIYVYMYVCMHVCMYICMHACMHVCIYLSASKNSKAVKKRCTHVK